MMDLWRHDFSQFQHQIREWESKKCSDREAERSYCCEVGDDFEELVPESHFNGIWMLHKTRTELLPLVRIFVAALHRVDARVDVSASALDTWSYYLSHLEQRVLVPLETSEAVSISIVTDSNMEFIHVGNSTVSLRKFGLAGHYVVATHRLGKDELHHHIRRVKSTHPLDACEMRVVQKLMPAGDTMNTTITLYPNVAGNETTMFDEVTATVVFESMYS